MPRLPITPRLLTDRELNIIRGKVMAASTGWAGITMASISPRDILSVFSHLDRMEMWLDEVQCDTDGNEPFGTEGWRHAIGHPDAD